MSHTTVRLFLAFCTLYTSKPTTIELPFHGICHEKVFQHLIRQSEGYRCLCKRNQSIVVNEFCENQINWLNQQSLWIGCAPETNRTLDCSQPFTGPSEAVIPATSTTKSSVSGGRLTVYSLQIERGNSLFRFLSELMGHLQPNELPLDLIKDVFVLKMPWQLVSLQLLKLEALGLFWIFLWFILSLLLPFSLITHFCFTPKRTLLDTSSESSSITTTKTSVFTITSTIYINFLLLSLLVTIIVLLHSNQQVSQTLQHAPQITELIMEDLDDFVQKTKEQAVAVANGATEHTINGINQDLEDVEELLGKSFQEHLLTETGIDVALSALLELQNAVVVMSTQTSDVLKACELAKKMRVELREELKDIFSQLLIAKYQCTAKDRSLCDTLQPIGFDVVFSVDNVTENQKLNRLSQLKDDATLNKTIKSAECVYKRIPTKIAEQTFAIRADIKGALEKRRLQITESVVELEETARNLAVSISGWREKIAAVTNELVEYDFWRWLFTLVVCFGIFITLIFIICGAPCGCSSSTIKTFCLSCSLISSSIFSLLIWFLASLCFLIGGHFHGFLCEPLNDHPQYKSISQLVDPDGLFFNDEGLWPSLLKRNVSVGFAEVLWQCERNESIFDVFDLKMADGKRTDFREVEDLFEKLTFDGHIEILTAELDEQLQDLISILSVNVTKERIVLAKPITGRDLNSFLDQLNAVVAKISYRHSTKRFEDLGFRIKQVIEKKIESLAKLRDEIVFNVTKLEVLTLPLNREVNQTMMHLKTAQSFLSKHAEKMAAEVTEIYRKKLGNHIEIFAQHFEQTTKQASGCHLLWKIFDVVRYNTCDLFTESMNTLSFCGFFFILLLLILAPAIVISMKHSWYQKQETPSMLRKLLEEHREAWATPVSVCSPELGHEISCANLESISLDGGSAVHSDVPLPPPPQLPSIPAIVEPQQLSPQVAEWRTRTPRGRFESLRFVQPISFKRSLSPANWF